VIVILGYGGGMTSIRPIDRLLNPDARNYWESPDTYLESIFNYCSGQADQTGSFNTFKRCYSSSIDGALERGYVSEKDLASFQERLP